MWETRWRKPVQLAPQVRERLRECLETLRVITDDVANCAEGMDDEELVMWVQALRDRATSMLRAAMD